MEKTRTSFWTWSWSTRHCELGHEKVCWFQCWKKLNCFRLTGLIKLVLIDVKMDGSVLEEKSSFKMLGLTSSSKLDWDSYIISFAKTASKKIGGLIRSMKFFSPKVFSLCMEYCCYVWTSTPSCFLELLDKLQKRIFRTVGPSLAAFLEPLAHRRNEASLTLFYSYFFRRCSSEVAQLVLSKMNTAIDFGILPGLGKKFIALFWPGVISPCPQYAKKQTLIYYMLLYVMHIIYIMLGSIFCAH